MTTAQQYKQLQPEDRVTIASLKQQGRGVRVIARTLDGPGSTVSHELRRNAVAAVGYASTPAHEAACARRLTTRRWTKLHARGQLWMVVAVDESKFRTALPYPFHR